jgi:U6 snRNA-associated Sm-like protein LSm1
MQAPPSPAYPASPAYPQSPAYPASPALLGRQQSGQGPVGGPGDVFGAAPRPPLVPPPGAALIEELDQKVMVQLGDGSKIIGILRSIDVHGNFVLEHTVLRHSCNKLYHDEPRGLEVIRGENVVLMGRVDPEREAQAGLEWVSLEKVRKAQEEERIADQMVGKIERQLDFLDL